MKEIPMLFSTSMVQALLDKRKIQTRRLVSPQPSTFVTALRWGKHISHCPDSCSEEDHVKTFFNDKCPYGQPGDLIYVRETWGVGSRPDPFVGSVDGFEFKADEAFIDEVESLPIYPCDGFDFGNYDKKGWRPSIHMPKIAARIWLQVTGIRVERLQDISQEDAQAEGMTTAPHRCPGWKNRLRDFKDCFICPFRLLWNQINGANGHQWDKNEWVWVVSFKVLSTTGKPSLLTENVNNE